VWSAPTVDPERGLLYVTTGDNYSEPATELSDAVIAMRLDNGQVVWSRQTTPGDVFNGYCYSRMECPGQDFDYGSSAILATTPDGRDVILAGQKSGVVYALDPDNGGAILWETRVGEGGVNGGVQWGMATDGQHVYAATSDVGRSEASNPDPNDPSPVPFDRTKGGGLSALRLSDGERVWYAAPATCGPEAASGCSPAQSAAVTAIPGVVFSGSLDGHLRAYSSEDGAVIWDFDTVREFDTVNRVPARGGALDGPGAVVVGGMVYVNSGYARTGGIAGNVLLAFGPAE
jgi:polyvinyl alcohol dehydrogenase (cytochrome)